MSNETWTPSSTKLLLIWIGFGSFMVAFCLVFLVSFGMSGGFK